VPLLFDTVPALCDIARVLCIIALYRCCLHSAYTGVEEAGSDEMMSLVQEAHIASVDHGDDRLGDDEWNQLSNTASLVGCTQYCL